MKPFCLARLVNFSSRAANQTKLCGLFAVAVSLLCAQASALAAEMCFERRYDVAHLSRHPDQLVTSMTLALDPRASLEAPFYFKIAMTKRGDNNLYVQFGAVTNMNGAYRGIVECAGGGFVLKKDPSGVLLSLGLGEDGDFIRMAVVPDPCGESSRVNNSVSIARGKDDHIFRLYAASSKVCSRLFDRIDWDAVGKTSQ